LSASRARARPVRDQSRDVGDDHLAARIAERIAGEMRERPLRPVEDLGHHLGHGDAAAFGQARQRGAEGEAEAVTADQQSRALRRDSLQRQHRELFLGELHPRAHQLVAPEHDRKVAPVADQRQRLSARDGGDGNGFAGKHRAVLGRVSLA